MSGEGRGSRVDMPPMLNSPPRIYSSADQSQDDEDVESGAYFFLSEPSVSEDGGGSWSTHTSPGKMSYSSSFLAAHAAGGAAAGGAGGGAGTGVRWLSPSDLPMPNLATSPPQHTTTTSTASTRSLEGLDNGTCTSSSSSSHRKRNYDTSETNNNNNNRNIENNGKEEVLPGFATPPPQAQPQSSSRTAKLGHNNNNSSNTPPLTFEGDIFHTPQSNPGGRTPYTGNRVEQPLPPPFSQDHHHDPKLHDVSINSECAILGLEPSAPGPTPTETPPREWRNHQGRPWLDKTPLMGSRRKIFVELQGAQQDGDLNPSHVSSAYRSSPNRNRKKVTCASRRRPNGMHHASADHNNSALTHQEDVGDSDGGIIHAKNASHMNPLHATETTPRSRTRSTSDNDHADDECEGSTTSNSSQNETTPDHNYNTNSNSNSTSNPSTPMSRAKSRPNRSNGVKMSPHTSPSSFRGGRHRRTRSGDKTAAVLMLAELNGNQNDWVGMTRDDLPHPELHTDEHTDEEEEGDGHGHGHGHLHGHTQKHGNGGKGGRFQRENKAGGEKMDSTAAAAAAGGGQGGTPRSKREATQAENYTHTKEANEKLDASSNKTFTNPRTWVKVGPSYVSFKKGRSDSCLLPNSNSNSNNQNQQHHNQSNEEVKYYAPPKPSLDRRSSLSSLSFTADHDQEVAEYTTTHDPKPLSPHTSDRKSKQRNAKLSTPPPIPSTSGYPLRPTSSSESHTTHSSIFSWISGSRFSGTSLSQRKSPTPNANVEGGSHEDGKHHDDEEEEDGHGRGGNSCESEDGHDGASTPLHMSEDDVDEHDHDHGLDHEHDHDHDGHENTSVERGNSDETHSHSSHGQSYSSSRSHSSHGHGHGHGHGHSGHTHGDMNRHHGESMDKEPLRNPPLAPFSNDGRGEGIGIGTGIGADTGTSTGTGTAVDEMYHPEMKRKLAELYCPVKMEYVDNHQDPYQKEELTDSAPTFICPRCGTRQREFFSVKSAPRQFESPAGFLALYFGIYVVAALFIFGLEEGWPPLDCVYFSVITLTTAGLGDLHPSTDGAKVVCSVFIYFGVACIGLLLGSLLASALDDESSKLAKEQLADSCNYCQKHGLIGAPASRHGDYSGSLRSNKAPEIFPLNPGPPSVADCRRSIGEPVSVFDKRFFSERGVFAASIRDSQFLGGMSSSGSSRKSGTPGRSRRRSNQKPPHNGSTERKPKLRNKRQRSGGFENRYGTMESQYGAVDGGGSVVVDHLDNYSDGESERGYNDYYGHVSFGERCGENSSSLVSELSGYKTDVEGLPPVPPSFTSGDSRKVDEGSPILSPRTLNKLSPVTPLDILNRSSHTRHISLDISNAPSLAQDFALPSIARRKFSHDVHPTSSINGTYTTIKEDAVYIDNGAVNDDGTHQRLGFDVDDDDEDSSTSSSSSSSEADTADDELGEIDGFRAARHVFLTLKQAVMNSVLIIAIGSLGFHYIENLNSVDSFYFTTVLLTTVGYGDIVPVTPEGKMFATIYVLVAGTVLLHNMSMISMIPLELRKRRIERAVLTQFGEHLDDVALGELATGPLIRRLQLEANRSDGLNECTREMFSLAMLVRLGRITERDVRNTFAAFRRLDRDNDGKLNSKDIIYGEVARRKSVKKPMQPRRMRRTAYGSINDPYGYRFAPRDGASSPLQHQEQGVHYQQGAMW